MDDTLVTNAEPQVVETDNSAVVSQDINVTPQDDRSQVVEQPTPMDDNVTYNNITVEPAINTDRDFTQNLVENAIHLEHDVNQDANAGVAMDNFLNNEYDYDHNEAGTYWVAGAINDVDTQMSFLNTLINEEMYDEMDLQKYYYDTTMATARAYAAQKKKETAYGFYRAAQEKAIAEAELTGWYMPAEGNYMLGQYTVAQNVLEDPNAPDDARARAQRISGTVEKWFAANQIGTRGIKCLNMMNYEENVRHNTIMGELQHEANQIAAAGNSIAAAGNDLKLREFKFQLEEYELQTGHNITKEIGLDNDNTIGHDVQKDYPKYQNLGGFKDGTVRVPKINKETGKIETTVRKDANGKVVKDKKGNVVRDPVYEERNVTALANLLSNSPQYYSAILGATNSSYVNSVLEANGIDSKDMYVKYRNDQSYASMKAFLNSEEAKGKNYITENSGAFESTNQTTGGKEIKTITVDNKVIAGTFEDGVFVPFTKKDKNKLLSDGKTSVETYLNKTFNDRNIDWSGTNTVDIDGQTYSLGRGSTTNHYTSVTNMKANGYQKAFISNYHVNGEKEMKKVETKMQESEGPKGTKDVDGNIVRNLEYVPDKYDSKYWNEFSIVKGEVNGKSQYYSVTEKGELKKVDSKDLKDVSNATDIKNGTTQDMGHLGKETDFDTVLKSSWIVGYDKKNDVTYMVLPHGDGTTEKYSVTGNAYERDFWQGFQHVEMVNNNLTDEDIKKAGFNTLENKVANKAAKASANVTRDEETIDYGPISTGGGGGKGSDGYEAQDTVTNRYGLFEKYNVDLLEQPQYASITDLNKLEEALQERNNINSFNQTKTTYTKPKTPKKGGK